ncbi:hypothetical protein ASF61_13380 [Duganella sp. Leaf126]|uniref:hypothetical protein n=1 Tax=Duganella sp. Leaf126 TaxID=1736266 RepID=UPI000700B212|nr:hypothetical protein [Duganella sp. Leaf126]KQQ33065.1 hypothetical protein ASF61_13380 [Duganella sp. Leaf126]
MTTTIFNYHTNVNDFASDVTKAVRQLFASLVGKHHAADVTVAQDSSEEAALWLSSAASDAAAHSPSLASELRYAAARA